MPDLPHRDKEEPITAEAILGEAEVLQRVIAEFSKLSPTARVRLFSTVSTFFGISTETMGRAEATQQTAPAPLRHPMQFQFSELDDISPKQFLHEKSPSTDVERVACLAYYLAKYRATPHFKTNDITSLNTEAAQRRFSNTAVAVDNATKSGYLVPSVKGCKQLSAAGEHFVDALPDREAAKSVMARNRPSKSGRLSKRGRSSTKKE